MAASRIIYQDWIVALGYDPGSDRRSDNGAAGYNQNIIYAVNQSLAKLRERESDFIRRFYFQGHSYRRISKDTGRPMYRLEALHARAIKKLRKYLYRQMQGQYGIPNPKSLTCIICMHDRQTEIESVLKNKREDETWRRIIKELRRDYDIKIVSPQQLISHVKYHMI